MSDVEDAVDQILEQWGRERPDLDCSPMGIIGRITQLQREVFLAPVSYTHLTLPTN